MGSGRTRKHASARQVSSRRAAAAEAAATTALSAPEELRSASSATRAPSLFSAFCDARKRLVQLEAEGEDGPEAEELKLRIVAQLGGLSDCVMAMARRGLLHTEVCSHTSLQTTTTRSADGSFHSRTCVSVVPHAPAAAVALPPRVCTTCMLALVVLSACKGGVRPVDFCALATVLTEELTTVMEDAAFAKSGFARALDAVWRTEHPDGASAERRVAANFSQRALARAAAATGRPAAELRAHSRNALCMCFQILREVAASPPPSSSGVQE